MAHNDETRAKLMESWAVTRAHLGRAASRISETADRSVFDEYLDHNELQLAADELANLGFEHGPMDVEFWDALRRAYENMGLAESARRCARRVDDLR